MSVQGTFLENRNVLLLIDCFSNRQNFQISILHNSFIIETEQLFPIKTIQNPIFSPLHSSDPSNSNRPSDSNDSSDKLPVPEQTVRHKHSKRKSSKRRILTSSYSDIWKRRWWPWCWRWSTARTPVYKCWSTPGSTSGTCPWRRRWRHSSRCRPSPSCWSRWSTSRTSRRSPETKTLWMISICLVVKTKLDAGC